MLEQSFFLQDTCEVISGLFNVVITIVDKRFIRVAGTAHYKDVIGEKAANPNVFKTIMEKNRTVIISDPGNETVCMDCSNRNRCTEKAAIYTPLKVNGEIVGGVGIIAFTDEQKQSGIFSDRDFFRFTEKLSEMISSKIEAQQYARRLHINLQENIAILNSVHDGVIAVNESGRIYQINQSASRFFGVDQRRYLNRGIETLVSESLLERIRKEKNFVDVEDKLLIDGVKTPILVTGQSVEENGRTYGKVLIFKSMKEARSIARKLLHEADYKVGFEDIIGDSPEIERVKQFSKKIAESDSTVLIRGESGTGKELFARAIHNDSKRRNGPFVAVNCAAIPEPLLESELFGYEDGAFTGAKRGGKIGKCELAADGTLFLDEVGDIPLFLQSKFLRMLQERAVERVGGNRTIPVDIRIIAATNRNLEEMIANSEYREDLYYRLNVIPIYLPPLRERKNDIITVSEFFLRKYCVKLGKQIRGISAEARVVMERYDWPGNLRELENAVECAVNIEPGGELTLQSLPERIRRGPAQAKEGAPTVIAEALPMRESRRKARQEEVLRALDKYGWDTKGKKIAAKSLGIGIATLYRILNE